MQYSDGTIIERLEGSQKGLRKPGKELMKYDRKLNTALLKDDDAFADLHELLLEPCDEMIRDVEGSAVGDQGRSLFFEGADKQKCDEYLRRFIRFICGRQPYSMEIWPACPADSICDMIDCELPDTSCYMRLRIKIVCILMSALPEQVFAEGKNWFSAFLSDAAEEDFIEVSDGMEFPLELDMPAELYPKTLRNKSGNPCRIMINYKSEQYRICLPANGFLRVVFGDKECKRLISVKGNISFNGSDTRNAVVQLADQSQISLYMYHKQYREPFELETGGAFTDASADGKGGAAVLTKGGIYYTRNGRLERSERLPVRVYGAGTLWARHYADGTLECNMRKKGGLPVNRAIAVAENRDRSILIRDEEGAWDCEGGVARKITDDKFVQCMMERFAGEDVCERTGNPLMKLHIRYDGKLGEG